VTPPPRVSTAPAQGQIINCDFMFESAMKRGVTGAKTRPCLIVEVYKKQNVVIGLLLAPITHVAPDRAMDVIETKKYKFPRVGNTDPRPEYIYLHEFNFVAWPTDMITPPSRGAQGQISAGAFRELHGIYAARRQAQGISFLARANDTYRRSHIPPVQPPPRAASL
jgi:hypothetical protein